MKLVPQHPDQSNRKLNSLCLCVNILKYPAVLKSLQRKKVTSWNSSSLPEKRKDRCHSNVCLGVCRVLPNKGIITREVSLCCCIITKSCNRVTDIRQQNARLQTMPCSLSLSLQDDCRCQTMWSVTPHGPLYCKYDCVPRLQCSLYCCKACDTSTQLSIFKSQFHKVTRHVKIIFQAPKMTFTTKKEKLHQKAKQNANPRTQWNERDQYEHDFPKGESGHESWLGVSHTVYHIVI